MMNDRYRVSLHVRTSDVPIQTASDEHDLSGDPIASEARISPHGFRNSRGVPRYEDIADLRGRTSIALVTDAPPPAERRWHLRSRRYLRNGAATTERRRHHGP